MRIVLVAAYHPIVFRTAVVLVPFAALYDHYFVFCDFNIKNNYLCFEYRNLWLARYEMFNFYYILLYNLY